MKILYVVGAHPNVVSMAPVIPTLTAEDLDRLHDAAHGRVLRVGSNRRFAPLAIAMRGHVVTDGQRVELLYRMAAGRLRADHRLNDPDEGGGYLLGERCPLRLLRVRVRGGVTRQRVGGHPPSGRQLAVAQRFSVTLTFTSGSIATILDGSESASGVKKELVEAHAGGKSAVLHDVRRLELRGAARDRVRRDLAQDKGRAAQFAAFRRRLDGRPAEPPAPLDTIPVTLGARTAAGGKQ